MGGKNDSTGRSAAKDQPRVSQLTQGVHDEERARIQKLITKIVEATRCKPDQAEIALLDADNNVEIAVNAILEKSSLETWTHQKTKKEKKKTESEEKRIVPRNGQFRRGDRVDRVAPRPQNGNGEVGRGPRGQRENGGETFDKNGDRRRPFPQKQARPPVQKKEEEDNSWVNGPLVFQRSELSEAANGESVQSQPPVAVQPIEQKPAEPVKACAAGPLSFAAVVARQAKVEPPKPVESPKQETRVEPPEPELLDEPEVVEVPQVEPIKMPIKSPAKPTPTKVNTSITHTSKVECVDQSLTEKLKNDLGLGASGPSHHHHSNTPKKEVSQSPKAVVEWAVDSAPPEVTFEFGGGAVQSPLRVPPTETRLPEPQKHEPHHAPPPPTNDASSRQQAIGQFHGHSGNRQQRSGNLSYADTSSVNYQPQPQDVRSNGATTSPSKAPQPSVQPTAVPQNQIQPSQQISQPSQQQPAQNHHPHQQQQNVQPMYTPPQVGGYMQNFPYAMYNPLAYPFGMGQMDFNTLSLMPQMAVTSAGPVQGVQSHHQPAQHHQNQQPTGHQRNDHYDLNKYNSNSLNSVSGSQNNGVSNQNPANSQLSQNQQRQQLLENASQNLGAGAVGPPPGFSQPNLGAPAPFVPQQSMNSIFSQFQLPYTPQMQFPYMVNQKLPQPVYQPAVEDQDVRLNQQAKMYNQTQEKFSQSNGSKDRNGSQSGQSQLSNYVPPNYNNVAGNQLLGQKKNYSHQAWNS